MTNVGFLAEFDYNYDYANFYSCDISPVDDLLKMWASMILDDVMVCLRI